MVYRMSDKSEDREIRKIRLKRMIEELKKKEGRGTELISLYIPPNKRISDVIYYLRQEYSTAENIKSDQTRKHVQDALVKVMERLKYYQQAPENGLVIFCGAIPYGAPGNEKMEIYVIEPPEPLYVNLYRCDDHFHVEYLEELLKEKEVYGLVSIDVNEAAIGVLEGSRLKILSTHTSGIPGKHRAGGQSARRFERLREMAVHQYFDRVARHVNDAFLSEEIYPRLKGILIGGPGFTKNEFVEEADLDYRLREKIIGYVDTNYSGEEGLREMVDKAKDILKNVKYHNEKKHMDEFLDKLARQHDLILYGLNDILRHLYDGIIDRILILDDFNYYYIKLRCKICGNEEEVFTREEEKMKLEYRTPQCKKCGGDMEIIEEKHIIDYLDDASKIASFKIIVITSDTEHGKILKQFGGIAAILRYSLNY